MKSLNEKENIKLKREFLALTLAVFILIPVFAGCKPDQKTDPSSNITASDIMTSSISTPNDSTDTSSETESSGIKKHKNTPQIGIYHLAMRWCDYYGEDFASRERQFREVVE